MFTFLFSAIRVLKKSVLDFFKASWQKRCFAKMLKSLKRKDRFNDSARLPGARSLFFNRLLSHSEQDPLLLLFLSPFRRQPHRIQ
jgi:hypothetical protein